MNQSTLSPGHQALINELNTSITGIKAIRDKVTDEEWEQLLETCPENIAILREELIILCAKIKNARSRA